jgi:hypothetical protein
MAVPREIGLAGQVGVDAKAILDLGGALGRHALLREQREEPQHEDKKSAHRDTVIPQSASLGKAKKRLPLARSFGVF